ncbi:hypothetical protein IGI04_024106 [Brassica rapa subsp. trilocularis]|uniref:Uncharacterized protein n=1 Tax=Brassica rapa subsp. trilocularis TaxID=1813537 RepID=A0ABQ7M5R5_BRACM|nr:hypothetical protein IGI04_024106 [Brassica rapa subsp. trilocularis]
MIRTLYNKKLPNEEKSDIKIYQNAQIYYERETSSEDFHEVQTTSRNSRRLPASPDDFQEVQTTEMEVQTTEMEVICKTSWKSSVRLPGSLKEIRERLKSFKMMNITILLEPFERRRENM